MTQYVLDASVAARFLLSESLSAEAAAVLRDYIEGRVELAAPSILTYEVGNTLWKAVRNKSVELDAAKAKQRKLFDLNITTVELESGDHQDTLEWAHTHDATYYDAAYIIAAKKLGSTLLTADNKLHRKSSEERSTQHLKDYIAG
ncbi:type II toxin-antitoxin system VapC family toxin [Candidatus Bathyarchaeota archaeon]|nr:type II toxin-antitoxin system VapC family toxin [Candidatus Bathyarchaeota archaeon]